ncbi:MAG: HRDC domain-containing protein [Candidatus Promineifilaceae bacterium]
MSSSIPSAQFVREQNSWENCIEALQQQSSLAIDLEANSLYAYQEQVCLIQISIPEQDFIIDPLAGLNLQPFGALLQNPAVEKIFHAAEYDLILMKREFGWKMENLFDTMWAARILGYKRVGLANLLEEQYGVRLNKKYQKANWCRRPLSDSQLTYAQMDTHYLHRLRDDLASELEAAGRSIEAQEIFEEQTQVEPSIKEFDPDSFWSINGVYDLNDYQKAILKAINIYRDEEAQRQNRPLFKVFGDKTMLQLAQNVPESVQELEPIHGMTSGQIKRYGQQILRLVRENKNKPAPPRPRRNTNRTPEEVSNRYEHLHSWRKGRARARGVESDVILSRQKLWNLAYANPKTMAELKETAVLAPWQLQTYGPEILDILRKS